MEPISWTTTEFELTERHPDWVWYAGLVFVIGAALSFFYNNIFFGIFLIIAGVCTVMFAGHAPKQLVVTIGEKGITVNEESFEYTRIKQFWIDETEKQDKLLLLVKGSFVPVITLNLEGVTAETVRAALIARSIAEVAMRESFGIKIAERLGF